MYRSNCRLLLNVARMEAPQLYDDYALLTFNLAEAYSLEEMMDMWEDDIELVILYLHVPSPSPEAPAAAQRPTSTSPAKTTKASL